MIFLELPEHERPTTIASVPTKKQPIRWQNDSAMKVTPPSKRKTMRQPTHCFATQSDSTQPSRRPDVPRRRLATKSWASSAKRRITSASAENAKRHGTNAKRIASSSSERSRKRETLESHPIDPKMRPINNKSLRQIFRQTCRGYPHVWAIHQR